jgi:hypothetical protein
MEWIKEDMVKAKADLFTFLLLKKLEMIPFFSTGEY